MFRYRNIRVILLTLALGLGTSEFVQYLKDKESNEQLQNAILVTPMDSSVIPEFRETFRACGLGYVQGYLSRDGAKLFEGTNVCDEPKASTDTTLFKDRRKVIYTTIVSGKSVTRIYQYPYGRCIEATSIELATGLENYLDDLERKRER